ncbi:uncharacterized protein LOC134251186 [Saccostrea cucullata]|uniref:uncharacterized protein LOC134251186 n=1 Tax=Saccostrea cuccullata TaxID=36930 RepID=UPI002ED57834
MANCRQFTLMTLVFLIEAADLAFDWIFYIQLHQTDDEYVTQNLHLPWISLGFCVLGTIVLIFEMINLGFEVYKERGPCLYADTVSMVTTWVEDVPQISLALVVAIHQQSLIHWVQFVKAAWALVELIFRGVGQCLYCCVISERHNKSVNHCIAVFKFLAQSVILGCSVAIYVHLLK